jgi:cytoskeletal protein CcmA (bactofilin family)
MKRKKKRKNFPTDSFIGAHSILEGAMHSERSVRVDGRLRGQIEVEGDLVVGRQGKVKGDIKAGSVAVAGHVVGDVSVDHHLEISDAGLLVGDLEAPTISVAEGGILEGFCKMVGEGAVENTPPEPMISQQELKNLVRVSDFDSTGRERRLQNATSNRPRIFHLLAFAVFLVLTITFFVTRTYFQKPSLDLQSKQVGALTAGSATRADNKREEQVSSTPKPQLEFVMEAPESSRRLMQEDEAEAQVEGSSSGRGSIIPPAVLGTASNANYARIENPTVEHHAEEGKAFRFKFKLVNPIEGELTAGSVAIVAALRPPHRPRFVSFPGMELDEKGLPAGLLKSLTFRIRRFKYVMGEFNFPLSQAESFSILIYNPGSQLVHKYTLFSDELTSKKLADPLLVWPSMP